MHVDITAVKVLSTNPDEFIKTQVSKEILTIIFSSKIFIFRDETFWDIDLTFGTRIKLPKIYANKNA